MGIGQQVVHKMTTVIRATITVLAAAVAAAIIIRDIVRMMLIAEEIMEKQRNLHMVNTNLHLHLHPILLLAGVTLAEIRMFR